MAKSSKKKSLEENKKATIEDAYKEAWAKFGSRKNITGIDIGFKYKDGESTNEKAIRFHVKEKLPPSALEAADALPEEIKGFPVDVLQANYKASLRDNSSLELTDRTQRFSTIQPGISIGHPNVTAGTLGLIVRDIKTGKPAILSNWHVLVGDNTATPGDEITQPGRYDGGRVPRDTIAKLERMILDSDGDAAIALITNDRPFDPEILDLNVTPTNLSSAEIGDIVIKSGRTTEVTKGQVEGKGRYKIDYSIGTVGIDGFRITTIQADNPNNIEISKGGDSGAVWLLDNSETLVGLHFAGETDPRPEEEYALACNATTIFSRLSISLYGNSSEVEKKALSSTDISNNLAAELANITVSNVLDNLDARQIRHWAKLLERNYPRLVNQSNVIEELENVIQAELSPLGMITIGFAVGAVTKLINKQNDSKISSEAFSLAVSAFLAGVLAGNNAIDGRL